MIPVVTFPTTFRKKLYSALAVCRPVETDEALNSHAFT